MVVAYDLADVHDFFLDNFWGVCYSESFAGESSCDDLGEASHVEYIGIQKYQYQNLLMVRNIYDLFG